MGEFEQVYREVMDYLVPMQTVYEQAVYHVLLRRTHAEGKVEVRLGQRTIARLLPSPSKAGTHNRGTEIQRSSQAKVKDTLLALARKGHVVIGGTTREGTLYTIKLPREIPECMAKINDAEKPLKPQVGAADYYTLAENRQIVFERDGYRCRYCETTITPDNATLDHVKPVSQGGTNSLDNLVTCCLRCNAIKAARKPEETLLDILDRFKAVAKGPDLT